MLRSSAIPLLALAVSGTLAASSPWAGCERNSSQRDEISLPGWKPQPTAFRDTSDLLRSIQTGTFADRIGFEMPEAKLPEPVTFRFDRGDALPADQLPQLRELAAALMSDLSLRVDLVGCSDSAGSEPMNRKISQARAEAVASDLEKLEVPVMQIGQVEGRGEDCEPSGGVVLATPRRASDDDSPETG